MRNAASNTSLDFAGAVLLGGLTSIGVHSVVTELEPFWAGALRFAPAALLLFALAVLVGAPFPAGRALAGAVLFGALDIGISAGFLYWGILGVPASLAAVFLAFVPLLTFLLAIVHRQESFNTRALAGALLAVAGIAVIFLSPMSNPPPLARVLALFAGVVCMAEANVIIKVFPEGHPVSLNAVAMTSGAVILVLLSLFFGETIAMPTAPTTWFWMLYLIVIGSCAVFILFIFVLERWTASAAAYAFVLMSVVGVAAAAVILKEPLTPQFLAGTALVLGGVYIGALSHRSPPSLTDVAADPEDKEATIIRRHC